MFMLISAILVATQVSAQATPPAGQATPPAAATVDPALALGRCMALNALAAPETVTPEAAAHAGMVACGTERAALDRKFQMVIAGAPAMSAPVRAVAQARYDAMLAGAEARVADRLREHRAAAAATPPRR